MAQEIVIIKGAPTQPAQFLVDVAMQDHYYYLLTGASPLQHKDKVCVPKAPLT